MPVKILLFSRCLPIHSRGKKQVKNTRYYQVMPPGKSKFVVPEKLFRDTLISLKILPQNIKTDPAWKKM